MSCHGNCKLDSNKVAAKSTNSFAGYNCGKIITFCISSHYKFDGNITEINLLSSTKLQQFLQTNCTKAATYDVYKCCPHLMPNFPIYSTETDNYLNIVKYHNIGNSRVVHLHLIFKIFECNILVKRFMIYARKKFWNKGVYQMMIKVKQ